MATALERIGIQQPQTYADYMQAQEELDRAYTMTQMQTGAPGYTAGDVREAQASLQQPDSPAQQLADRADERHFQIPDFDISVDLPGIPEMPDRPDMVDMPDLPEFEDRPDTPDLPNIPDMPDRPGMGLDDILAETDALPDELSFPDQPDIDFQTPDVPESPGLDRFLEKADTLLTPEFERARESMAMEQARRGMAGMPAADVMQRELSDERAARELEAALGLRQDEFTRSMQQFEGELAAEQARTQAELGEAQAQTQHFASLLEAVGLEQQGRAQEWQMGVEEAMTPWQAEMEQAQLGFGQEMDRWQAGFQEELAGFDAGMQQAQFDWQQRTQDWEMQMQETLTPFQLEMERSQLEHQMGLDEWQTQAQQAQFNWQRHMDTTGLLHDEHMFREQAGLEQLLQEQQMEHDRRMQRQQQDAGLIQQAMQQGHQRDMLGLEHELQAQQQLAHGAGLYGGAAMQTPGFGHTQLDNFLRQFGL